MAQHAHTPQVSTAPAPVAAHTVADPAHLGLAAFAVTTLVLSTFNAGLIPKGVESVVLGSALFYGGLVQVLAGMWEYKRNNTFGATAFSSYGGFWMSFWGIVNWLKVGEGATKADAGHAVGVFLLAWTIFTGIMLVASMRTNKILPIVFASLFVTFALLAFGDLMAAEGLTKAGGYLGIVTAILAFYACAAAVINETWKQPVLPA